MGVPSSEFEPYLAPDESVVAGSDGSLYDDSYRSAGSVGVTDRRVLFVAEDGGFVDVAHGAIESIRSRPRSTIVYQGIGRVLVALAGALVAASAIAGVLVLAPSPLALPLGLLAVGGVVAAELVRRHGSRSGRLGVARERIADAAGRTGLRRELGHVDVDLPEVGLPGGEMEGDDDLLVVGIVSVALLASIGLIALAESLLVVPLALLALGGIAVSEYGYRRLGDREVGKSRRHELEVSIHLVDGSVVTLWVDPDGRFDRDLSVLARESVSPERAAEPPRP